MIGVFALTPIATDAVFLRSNIKDVSFAKTKAIENQ